MAARRIPGAARRGKAHRTERGQARDIGGSSERVLSATEGVGRGGLTQTHESPRTPGWFSMRILIVEDEPELAQNTADFLRENGFDVDIVETLCFAWAALQEIDYPLVLLDRRLPDGEGLQLIDQAQRLDKVPRFLVFSALGETDDKVAGLNIGATDYVVKPFEPKELLARIRALLRLPRATRLGAVTIGRLSYDRAAQQFSVGGERFDLRRREFDILESLAARPNHLMRRRDIINRVYGLDEAPSSNAVDSAISRLRARLAAADAGVQIHTARGLGYVLREAATES